MSWSNARTGQDIIESAPGQIPDAGVNPPPEAGAPLNHSENYIYTSSKALVEYCVSEDIDSVIYLDRSARPAHAGVNEYRRLAYPNVRLGTFFLNPDGVKMPRTEDEARTLLADPVEYALKVEERFRVARSGLLAKKDAPLLLFDICAHSGNMLSTTKETLTTIGFAAIKTGVLTDNTLGKGPLELDFCFATHEEPLDCQAFGRDDEFQEDPDHIYITKPKGMDMGSLAAQRNSIMWQVRAGFIDDPAHA